MKIIIMTIILNFMSSCQTINSIFFPNENLSENNVSQNELIHEKELTDELKNKQEKNWKSANLTHAKILERLENLEQLVLIQKQKMAILEKGILLGIPAKEIIMSLEQKETISPINLEAKQIIAQNKMQDNKMQDNIFVDITEHYLQRITEAKGSFEKGEYGEAYLKFSRIDTEFSDDVKKGEIIYWVGRCWYKLKEYEQAVKYFERYLKEYKNQKEEALVLFYAAKTNLKLGYRKKAINLLKSINVAYSNHPINESAQLLMQKIRYEL